LNHKWFPAASPSSGPPDLSDRGLKLRDVIWLVQDGRALMSTKATIDMRLIVSGGDDDRKLGALLAKFDCKRVATSVG
jgi:hypothetical protein